MRIAGCDLGTASASFVTGQVAEDGNVVLDEPVYVLHDGKPFEAFRAWYEDQRIDACVALGATGAYASELEAPVMVLPEDACQEAALSGLVDLPEALNVLSIGARGFGVLAREPSDRPGVYQVRFVENEKCSSGTGENMVKIASRFGLTIEQADELARAASGNIPITARCSVFAKSEMTHYANQGKATADLFAGYFSSVARNAGGLLARNRVDGPVVLIGGCAKIQSFRQALETHLDVSVIVPEHYLAFEAIGAAKLAAESARNHAARLPASADALVRTRGHELAVLEPARRYRDRVTLMSDNPAPDDWTEHPAILGLDLGSTGAKAVLTSIETGEPLLDVYDRTRGNPVDAARRLIAAILERGRPDVRAIGLTGSGREAAATLLRAVLDADRILVENEIVAHATAAIRCDEGGGRDLSIIEIGGQDAKYIAVRDGRIVDSDMNKACSAGTGSFLEEQGQFYDVHDIERFAALATAADRPPDLGQMCTVYVADTAAAALREGFELGDIFAGFQYSIVHNYLDRVMGQRTLSKTVFFQGKPASNASLAWTLAAVTGRDVVVPPNPGAMGAWGIGIHAIERRGVEVLRAASSIELEPALRAEVHERSTFTCRDPQCRTLCPIEKTTIRVGGDKHVAVSGGACPKFESAGRYGRKLDKTAPNPFDDRAAMLAACEYLDPERPTVAVPVIGPLAGYVPWAATLLKELGYSVRLLFSGPDSLARGEQLCNSFDSCTPTKVAHAICDTDAPLLFFPKILDLRGPCGVGGQSCVTEQAMPELTEQALRARGRDVFVLCPSLRMARGLETPVLMAGLMPLCGALQVSPFALTKAMAAAAKAQRSFERALDASGQRALAYARERGMPSVVVCGPLHVIHDPATNATIPTLLRQNGAMAIPMDAFPLSEDTPAMKKVYWAEPNRHLRAAAAARGTRDVFPLMISAFGCGPASFVEQVFHELLAGHPHTILESDGHGGTAGFVTRIQAFMHSVTQFMADKPVPSERPKAWSYVERGNHRGKYLDRSVRYVFLSSIDYLGPLFAAVYRSYGYDAVTAPALSKENFELGRRDCSGKECLSYQFVWGAFRQYLQDNPPQPGTETRLVQISGQMCRAGVFGIKDRISLDKLGLEDRVTVTSLKVAGGPGMTARLWAALCAVDVVRQLHLYHLPQFDDLDRAEKLYRGFGDRIVSLAEQPMPRRLAEYVKLGRDWSALRDLVQEASEAYAGLPNEQHARKTVFVTGDLMTKGSDFANGGIYWHLSKQGIRVLAEPACDFLEYLAHAHPHLIFGSGASARRNLVYKTSMIDIRNRVYDLARRWHPWLPKPDLKAVLKKTAEVLDVSTNGGAALAVGSALHHWEKGHYDGLLTTACWGCDNGLIGESLLRHHREIPSYFYYDDATPLDERKLRSFAFRLQR